MLKFFTKIRLLLWVAALAGVGVLVGMQVNAKLAQAAANLKSLETQTVDTYPVETETLKSSDWETWRSYYGQAKSAHTQNITTFEREIVSIFLLLLFSFWPLLVFFSLQLFWLLFWLYYLFSFSFLLF